MSFNSEVDAAIKGMERLAEKQVKGSLLGVFSRTISRTPIVSGRLRNNWHTGIGQVKEGQRKGNRSGVNSLNDAMAVMNKQFKIGDIVFFSNNLPYARRIEYGGFSKAPRGMLRISVRELIAIMRKIK